MKRFLVSLLIILFTSMAWAIPPAPIPPIRCTDCTPFIADGVMCYNTSTDKFYVGNGTAAIEVVNTSTTIFPAAGVPVYDTNSSHTLYLKAGSDITANKTLTFTTGDADRTITLSGNPTLGDWFDQAVKAASTPTFGGLTVTGLSGIVLASAGILGVATAGTDYLAPTTPEIIVTKNASYTLGTDVAKENYGGMVYLTATATLTLPSAVSGMSGCAIATGTFSISVDVNVADHWVLNGTALTAGNKVTSSGVVGDTLCWSCGAANTWYILPGANVNWTDGG